MVPTVRLRHRYVTSALGLRKFRPLDFCCTECTRGWVGPRAGLDIQARGKILSTLTGIESRLPGCLARSQTLY
jgi:hypothetical protein